MPALHPVLHWGGFCAIAGQGEAFPLFTVIPNGSTRFCADSGSDTELRRHEKQKLGSGISPGLSSLSPYTAPGLPSPGPSDYHIDHAQLVQRFSLQLLWRLDSASMSWHTSVHQLILRHGQHNHALCYIYAKMLGVHPYFPLLPPHRISLQHLVHMKKKLLKG